LIRINFRLRLRRGSFFYDIIWLWRGSATYLAWDGQ
jgi:hypothetical protein